MATLHRVILFAASIISFSCLLMGCSREHGSANTNPVPIEGAKFLKTDVKVEDFNPSGSDETFIETSRIPRGKIPASSTPGYVVAGRSHFAVVTEKGRGRQLTQNGVWVFNKQWKTVGLVVGLPFHAASESTNIEALWNKAGDMLAIVVDCSIKGTHNIDIGTINLKTRHFQHLLSLKMFDSASVVWAGNQLFTSSSDNRNGASWTTILEINPAKKQVREMYREKMDSDSDIWIQNLLPSPSGNFIAFDRRTPWQTEGAGVDVLNTKTGITRQLTSEPRTNYYHYLGRWKDNYTLLFLRHNVPVSRCALYEVTLDSSWQSKAR